MIRLSCRFQLLFLIFVILLYDGVESKRGGGSSGGRGSSSARSSGGGWGGSSKSSGSSGKSGGWFGGSSSTSSSSLSSNWGSSRSSSSSHGSGSSSYGSSSYGSSNRGWNNRYYGNHFVVMRTHTYYGGGGYGNVYSSRTGSTGSNSVIVQQRSDSPTISTDMIRDALFVGIDRIPSMQIFEFEKNDFRPRTEKKEELTPSQEGLLHALKYHIGREKAEGHNPGADRVAKALENEGKDKTVTIKDETKPVLVGSISYFWGDDNLPKGDIKTNCVDFSQANDAANFTVCKVSSMIRCQKSLAEVVIVGKKERNILDKDYSFDGSNTVDKKIIVNTANGTMADSFSWFCPPSDKCCEWECCSTEEKAHQEFAPPDEEFKSTVHILLIVGMIAIGFIICCSCYKFAAYTEKKEVEQAKRMLREHRERRERRERRPLTRPTAPTGNYPKHARDPDGGKYGWNLAPSAPPM